MVLGHAFLGAAAAFSLNLYTEHELTWSIGAFALFLGHGVLGILFCCNDTPSHFLKLFSISLELVEIVPLPFINAELYLEYSGPDIALIHAFTGIIPLIFSLFVRNSINEDIKDVIIIANVISLVYLSIKKKKVLLCVLAAIAALNRFHVTKGGRTVEGLSFGLAAFCLLSAYNLKNAEFSTYL